MSRRSKRQRFYARERARRHNRASRLAWSWVCDSDFYRNDLADAFGYFAAAVSLLHKRKVLEA